MQRVAQRFLRLSAEQWLGIGRHALTIAGTVFASWGIFDGAAWAVISGSVMAILSIALSVESKEEATTATTTTTTTTTTDMAEYEAAFQSMRNHSLSYDKKSNRSIAKTRRNAR